MIIGDVVMCAYLIAITMLIYIMQYKVTSILQIDIQNIEDFSIVVNDPSDVDDPDTWMKFFSRFGSNKECVVRYITVTKRNDYLIKLLHKKKLLQLRLKTIRKLQPLTNEENEMLKQIYLPPNDNEEISDEQLKEWYADFHEFVNTRISEGDFLTLAPSNIFDTVMLCFSCKLLQPIRKSLTLSEAKMQLLTQLIDLEKRLEEAYKSNYSVDRVYVTFEKQRYRNLALNALEVPDWLASFNFIDPNQTRHVFNGNNILDVCQTEEPHSILWSNTQVSNIIKYLYFFRNIIIIAGVLVGSYFAIDQVQNYDAFKTVGGTAILVTIIENTLPFIFKNITDMESKDTETVRQKELHRRLFYAKLLVLVIFPYVLTSWDEFLTSKKLDEIRSTQFLTLLVTPVINFVDIGGFVNRHILGHIFARSQKEYNQVWSGKDWSLSERYVEA